MSDAQTSSFASVDTVQRPAFERPSREDWVRLRAMEGKKSFEKNGAPALLLEYQRKIGRALEKHNVVVVEKSRRIGVTWGAASFAALTAASAKNDNGMDVLYIGYDREMAREFIDTCAEWAREYHEAVQPIREEIFEDGPDNSILSYRINFASKFHIQALSSRPRGLRGRQGIVILDEAAFHDDFKSLLEAALAFLMWGGKILVISTHFGDANFFNTLVQDIRSGKSPYHLIRVDFDEALRNGLYERICYKQKQEWSAEKEAAWRDEIMSFYGEAGEQELYCIPSSGSGLWLTTPLIEARMQAGIEVLRLEKTSSFSNFAKEYRQAEVRDWCEQNLRERLAMLDKNRQHYFGVDFGRVSDLTVIWPLTLETTVTRRTPFVVELRNIPFEEQATILFYIADRLPRLTAGKLDATGNGAYLAEVAAQRYGEYRIEQVKLSQEWYRETMPRVRRHFEEATIVLPKNTDILEDLRLVRIVKGIAQIPPARTKASDGTRRHGDAAVALALAVAASESDPSFYAYDSPARRERQSLRDGTTDLWEGASDSLYSGIKGAA